MKRNSVKGKNIGRWGGGAKVNQVSKRICTSLCLAGKRYSISHTDDVPYIDFYAMPCSFFLYQIVLFGRNYDLNRFILQIKNARFFSSGYENEITVYKEC